MKSGLYQHQYYFLGMACLTKTTAIAGALPFLYLISRLAGNAKSRMLLCVLAAIELLAVIAAYNLIARHFYPQDFEFFRTINFNRRISLDPMGIIYHSFDALRQGQVTGQMEYFVVILATLVYLLYTGLNESVLTRL